LRDQVRTESDAGIWSDVPGFITLKVVSVYSDRNGTEDSLRCRGHASLASRSVYGCKHRGDLWSKKHYQHSADIWPVELQLGVVLREHVFWLRVGSFFFGCAGHGDDGGKNTGSQLDQ
jgi:hypothetical protein